MSVEAMTIIITLVGAVLTVMGVTQGHLWSRLRHTEGQVSDLWDKRREDAIVIRNLGDHIDKLEHHIWTERPPPPPERPYGL